MMMNWVTIPELVFYFFSFIATLSALMVIISKNSVHSVLSLILCFFATGAIWLLLEAEFLALTLVLVYVGAVMVLFLFVVMMLDVELASIREGFTRHLPLGLCVAVLIIIGLVYAVASRNFGSSHFPIPEPHAASFSQVKSLGILLYSDYLYPFELAGVLLLVAIVAAISLTHREPRDKKVPKVSNQMQVQKADRLTILKMPFKKIRISPRMNLKVRFKR